MITTAKNRALSAYTQNRFSYMDSAARKQEADYQITKPGVDRTTSLANEIKKSLLDTGNDSQQKIKPVNVN